MRKTSLQIKIQKVFISFEFNWKIYLTTHFLNEVFGGSVDDESMSKFINWSHNDSISVLFDEAKIDWLYTHFNGFVRREVWGFTCRIISATFSSPFPVEGIGRASFFERKDIFTFVYLQKHSVGGLPSNELLFVLWKKKIYKK